MTFKVTSQEEFVIASLVSLVRESKASTKESYSNAIEFGLSEIIRSTMRRIAQDNRKDYQGNELFNQALEIVKSRLEVRLEEYQLEFDFSKYSKTINEKLKFPAREIADLSSKLTQSRQIRRIGSRTKLLENHTIPLEITEVGLRDSIEGLLAVPMLNEYDVDIERIKETYEVEGDWFPYKITFEDFVFIVDDDGTIFVFTEHFPPKMLATARRLIEALANQLYFSGS